MSVNNIVQLKISQVKNYIDSELRRYPEVRGFVIVGSVSEGTCREDSDIDAYVFFEPLDLSIIPGEFCWDDRTGEYFSIFEGKGTVQIDSKRVGLEEMGNIEWPDEWKSELASGIIVYDPTEEIKRLLNEKTAYPENLRTKRIMESILRISNDCLNGKTMNWIERGTVFAHDQLNIGLEDILKILYAYNSTYTPWRNRWLTRSLELNWLPGDFKSSIEEYIQVRELSTEDVKRRFKILQKVFSQILDKLTSENILPKENPVGYCFNQLHKEIGYAGTMDDWLKAHKKR